MPAHTGTARADAHPLCKLRVQILSARGLAAKDRNGKSDPFVVVSLPGTAESSHQTAVKPNTLDPVWKDTEATFEYDVLPDWFGPHLGVIAAESVDPDVVQAILSEAVTPASGIAPSPNVASASAVGKGGRPRAILSSASARKIGGAATKLLSAPVKLGAAGAKAVGRGVPRPMRLKRRLSGLATPGRGGGQGVDSLESAPNLLASNAPRGSVQLDAANATVSSLEFVLWDKDKFSGDDYLGECSLLVRGWCPGGEADWARVSPIWLPVASSRPDSEATGEVQVKIGFVEIAKQGGEASSAADPHSWTIKEVYQRLALASLGSEASAVRAVPASQSVGTVGPTDDFLDDGLSSDSDDEDHDEDDDDDGSSDVTASELDDDVDASSFSETDDERVYNEHYESIAAVPAGSGVGTGAAAVVASTPASEQAAAQQTGPGRYRRIFSRRKTGDLSKSSSGTSTPSLSGVPAPMTPSAATELSSTTDSTADSGEKRRRRIPGVRGVSGVARRRKQSKNVAGATDTDAKARGNKRRVRGNNRKRQDYSFKAEMGMDIIGIVMMEVKNASDLPRWRNMTHTSFDMDPFTIVSFGQKVFRTKVARHTLNPVWNEKLLFHVRRNETNFQVKFQIYDWDKMSSNDYVGGASIDMVELIELAPKPNAATGLYDAADDGLRSMKEFRLPLMRLEKDEEVKFKGSKKAPSLLVKANFTQYEALRQRFWRQLALQYDTNDNNTLSLLELTSMLDSLGSTLTTRTIESFFLANGKKPDEDELTLDEVILALEDEIKKPWTEKRRIPAAGTDGGLETPGSMGYVSQVGAETNRELDMTGANAPVAGDETIQRDGYFSGVGHGELRAPVPPTAQSAVMGIASEPMVKPIPEQGQGGAKQMDRDMASLSLAASRDGGARPHPSQAQHTSSSATASSSQSSARQSPSPLPPTLTVEGQPVSGGDEDPNSVERVIRLKSCPLCHMPRLSKKGEVDIVTHLAVCASQDWRRVDSLAETNFVTANQAHRKWYTKVVNKISQGNYSLGANNANIIVQDRLSGELMEEKMQVYVRLGIRLLYKGARSRMEGARIKKMLKNMSVKQGVKFDSPSSAREIAPFIAFHNLDLDEIRDPLDSFKTFNEFFYRKLKPEARPNAEPDNPRRLVSGADCRMMVFESVQEATRIWIKGRDFTVARLLGDAAKGQPSLEAYQNGGSVAISRLAPQDYHRFHCPADATVGKFTWIEGQYYTVNPMAIRSTIDVYGENIRIVVPFHSDEFGTFYAVCIGAMMVGSTVLTVKEGDRVKRGQEFGYFKFGGSTIVLVFESGRMMFDDDILDNSRAAIETLVRVGMGIGRTAE